MSRRLSSFGPESHERMGVENTVKSVLESQGTNIGPGQLTAEFWCVEPFAPQAGRCLAGVALRFVVHT